MLKITIDNDGIYIRVFYRTDIVHLYSIGDDFFKSTLLFCTDGCTLFEHNSTYCHTMRSLND